MTGKEQDEEEPKQEVLPLKNRKKAKGNDLNNEELGVENRVKNWAEDNGVREQLEKLYPIVTAGYDDKNDQNLTIDRCWDVYNCVLNENQGYNGYSQVYVPIVKDALEARVTRFTGQLFPSTGRYSDVTSTDGTMPYEIMSLLDHYVTSACLRDEVVPALIRSGDITGQYSIQVDWNKIERFVTKRVQHSELETEHGVEVEGGESFEDIETEKVTTARPAVEVLDSRNLLILPSTVDNIDDAEVVAVAIRLTKEGVDKYVEDGIFDEDEADYLLENFSSSNRDNQPETQKKAVNAAGVKTDSKGSKTALIYKVWSKVKLAKGKKRWCVTYFAGENCILSCKRNPYWNDKIDVVSKPALKVSGSIWGKSRIEGGVEKLQYSANDAVNMGFDSAQYSLAPIVMTDPEKNPRSGSIVMAMAAVWLTDPNSTEVVNFPQLWKEAFAVVMDTKQQIQQSLNINPAMIPQGNAGKKPTQAQVAQEQQVAIESTINEVTILEIILSGVLQLFYDMDYQYRDKKMLIKQYGPLGQLALMEEVPLLRSGTQYVFKWFGTEANKTVQQVQQMIAAMNVFKGIPPEQLNGRKFDAGPILDSIALNVFGPRLAPQILIDQRHQLSVPPEQENEMLEQNFWVEVNPMDDDVQHMKLHHEAMVKHGDGAGFFRAHMIKHMKQMQEKAKKQMGMDKPQGTPGMPGGAGNPGAPGSPRPGAISGPPKPVQAPAGAIHQDQMNDPSRMPR